VWILGDIFLVVVIEELVMNGGQVNGQRNQTQRQADQDLYPLMPHSFAHAATIVRSRRLDSKSKSFQRLIEAISMTLLH